MTDVSITLSDRGFTKRLKAQTHLAGQPVTFPTVDPIHDAFGRMARGEYDISEMAIATFLQARDLGKPLLALPVVMAARSHHRSLFAAPKSPVSSVGDLRGARVGVRSYSQTTGLWVRGWLEDEFGLSASAMNWIVFEGSHVAEYRDPDNVTRVEGDVDDAYEASEIDAAIFGGPPDPNQKPLLADFAERDRADYERRGWIPINHLVVVDERFLADHPEVVRETYRLLAEGMAHNPSQPPKPGGLPAGERHGYDRVAAAAEVAARYAHQQGLIASPVSDVRSLFCFE